jgi:hypothetical protein
MLTYKHLAAQDAKGSTLRNPGRSRFHTNPDQIE